MPAASHFRVCPINQIPSSYIASIRIRRLLAVARRGSILRRDDSGSVVHVCMPKVRKQLMTERSEFRLERVDVAVSAEHHNPSMLTPEFLRLSGVVPSHWEPEEAELGRDFSSVLFYNGILWVMDQERLIIEDSQDGLSFSQPFEVHRLTRRYLEEVRTVLYRNLVLSFHGRVPTASSGGDPRHWLAEQLLRPDKLNAGPSGRDAGTNVLVQCVGSAGPFNHDSSGGGR